LEAPERLGLVVPAYVAEGPMRRRPKGKAAAGGCRAARPQQRAGDLEKARVLRSG